jgi:cell shape-determining protein MreC
MPANADVKDGDVLVTSGLDGIFLAGLSGRQGGAHRT